MGSIFYIVDQRYMVEIAFCGKWMYLGISTPRINLCGNWYMVSKTGLDCNAGKRCVLWSFGRVHVLCMVHGSYVGDDLFVLCRYNVMTFGQVFRSEAVELIVSLFLRNKGMLLSVIKYGNNEVAAKQLLLARNIVSRWDWVDISKDGRGRIVDLRTAILWWVMGDGRITHFCGFAAMGSACWDSTLGDDATEFVRMGYLHDGLLAG